MTPVEFIDEETTTFRKNIRLQNSVFFNKNSFSYSNKRYGEEEDIILFIMAK